MIIQCCACKRVREEGGWVEVAEPERVARRASHGYCPACAAKAVEDANAALRIQKRRKKVPPAA
jgi:hypothetical protein